jgi:hypothetical protein
VLLSAHMRIAPTHLRETFLMNTYSYILNFCRIDMMELGKGLVMNNGLWGHTLIPDRWFAHRERALNEAYLTKCAERDLQGELEL